MARRGSNRRLCGDGVRVPISPTTDIAVATLRSSALFPSGPRLFGYLGKNDAEPVLAAIRHIIADQILVIV